MNASGQASKVSREIPEVRGKHFTDAPADSVEIRVTRLLDLMAEIPYNSHLRGPKYRDMLSSCNWVIGNFTVPSTVLTADLIETLCGGVLTSMTNSNKNGEKAKRVVSEGLRAFRNLLLAPGSRPSVVLDFLLSEPNLRSLTFFAGYLVNPNRALRDNAVLLMGAIAYGVTAGWELNEDTQKQQRLHEQLALEFYKLWSVPSATGGPPLALEQLKASLEIMLESAVASDCECRIRLLGDR